MTYANNEIDLFEKNTWNFNVVNYETGYSFVYLCRRYTTIYSANTEERKKDSRIYLYRDFFFVRFDGQHENEEAISLMQCVCKESPKDEIILLLHQKKKS